MVFVTVLHRQLQRRANCWRVPRCRRGQHGIRAVEMWQLLLLTCFNVSSSLPAAGLTTHACSKSATPHLQADGTTTRASCHGANSPNMRLSLVIAGYCACHVGDCRLTGGKPVRYCSQSWCKRQFSGRDAELRSFFEESGLTDAVDYLE